MNHYSSYVLVSASRSSSLSPMLIPFCQTFMHFWMQNVRPASPDLYMAKPPTRVDGSLVYDMCEYSAAPCPFCLTIRDTSSAAILCQPYRGTFFLLFDQDDPYCGTEG